MKALILTLALALSTLSANAGVVYVDYPDNTFFPGGGTGEVTFQLLYGTPLNQDRGAEFVFKFQPTQLSFERFPSQAPTSGALSTGGIASKLTFDSIIGPSQPWSSAGQLATPQWAPDNTIGYLGARANPAADSSTFYYGWIRVSYNSDHSMTLYDWAYESSPNLPIAAGTVPEPSFLFLGLVGAGAFAMRYSFRLPVRQGIKLPSSK